jgi:hypothetical protein
VQFLDAASVCKSEHQDFKKAKERTWSRTSVMGQCKSEGKDSKRDYAKEKLRENMGQSKSKEETLKNRKEDFRSKVLKNRKKHFRSKVLRIVKE